MPVTFCPAANTKIEPYGAERTFGDRNSAWLFQKTYRDERPIVEHLQSSFGRGGSQPAPVTACNNGFVDTLVDAYSRHHALVIRPDDVWTCILTQFSLFVNGKGRAERLRHLFVAHEGKRKLTITTVGTRHSVDFGALAREMTEKIHENVVDPELRAWILPDFSTTTENDTVVASTIMMATLKAYFKYSMMLMCGLPRVTLLGTLDDWTRILHRVDKLVLYGPETTAWRNLLRPVLARFVKAFEPGYADSAENLDFWQRVAHRESGGSGPTYLSGWITAFCAFGDSGQWLGSKGSLEKTETHDSADHTLGTIEYLTISKGMISHMPTLKMDGVQYHVIDSDNVPPSTAEVDVQLNDNGQELECVMVAGIVGASSRSAKVDGGDDVCDGEIQPVSAWWMFTVGPKPARKNYDMDD